MANGGIIGPINDPIINNTSTTQAFTSSGTFTSRANQISVVTAVIAGGVHYNNKRKKEAEKHKKEAERLTKELHEQIGIIEGKNK